MTPRQWETVKGGVIGGIWKGLLITAGLAVILIALKSLGI
jgi:hypothetical protein